MTMPIMQAAQYYNYHSVLNARDFQSHGYTELKPLSTTNRMSTTCILVVE